MWFPARQLLCNSSTVGQMKKDFWEQPIVAVTPDQMRVIHRNLKLGIGKCLAQGHRVRSMITTRYLLPQLLALCHLD